MLTWSSSQHQLHLRLELGVQPKVDDGVDTHCRLGDHGGDCQDVDGEGGVGDIPCGLCYGDTSVWEPGYQERDNLIEDINRTDLSNSDDKLLSRVV